MQGGSMNHDWSPVVARLRALHDGNPARPDDASERQAARSSAIATPRRRPASGRAVVPAAVLDELRRIHRDRAPTPRPEPAPADDYARIRELFRKREQNLRREASVVDLILDRMRADRAGSGDPSASPLQQDLRVSCRAGGSGRGRFVVANDTGSACVLQFQPHRPRAGEATAITGAALRFVPDRVPLAVGESREIDLFVSLAGCAMPTGGRFEWPIDLCSDVARIGRLWLEIVVADPA